MDKHQLRGQFCDLRDCLASEEVERASDEVCQRLAAWLPGQLDRQRAGRPTILAYLAFRNEIDLRPLFDLMPDVRWALPRTERDRLVIHPYVPGRVKRHRFGMLEPVADLPIVEPQKLNIALIPGVSFDRRGGRLGLGGGYYDRFLPRTDALRVGITYDCCLADRLPCADYDQRMDWVVTPTELIHTAPLWRETCPRF